MTENILSTPPCAEEEKYLYIEQDDKVKYLFIVKITFESIVFIVTVPKKEGNIKYLRKITLNEIKEKIAKNIFMGLNSCFEFYDYLKILSDLKKITITQDEDKLTINFIAEYFFKKHKIEIDLFSEKINFDSFIDFYKEFILLKQKIKNINDNENYNDLKNEIKAFKEEIKELKEKIEPIIKRYNENININQYIFKNESVIMKKNEFDLIHLAIKSRMNKTVKELKKLYQASIDGDGAINFHSRCDNIPNTLVLIQSKGNRRFGGFVSNTWESSESGNYKEDKNAFLFSLDKQKIYCCKNHKKAMNTFKDNGPNFEDIIVCSFPIQDKKLTTYESWSETIYDFKKDKNALSESGNNPIYVTDYEVFQVIFK